MKKFFGGDKAPASASLPEGASSSGGGGGLAAPTPTHPQARERVSSGGTSSLAPPPVNNLPTPSYAAPGYDGGSMLGSVRSTSPLPGLTPSQQAAYFDFGPPPSMLGGVGGGPSTPGLYGAGTAPTSPAITAAAVAAVASQSYPSQAYPVQAASVPGSAIERTDLHRSLKNLEALLVGLDEYRDLAARMAKCEKRLAKGCKELGSGKAYAEVPSQTLLSSSALFDSTSDVSQKYAKLVQKEYESLNDSCAKFFKRVAKEERAHDELLETLDSKVKKAHAGHEKAAKRAGGGRALESHDKYIATVSALTQDIARAKAAHSASVGSKNAATSAVVAATIGGLADAEWRRACEVVRREGTHVGRLNAWLNLAVSEAMPVGQPAELGEEEIGRATLIAMAEAQAQANAVAREQQLQQARETALAAWTAKQMGWLPPGQAQPQSPAVVPDQQQQYQQQQQQRSSTPQSQANVAPPQAQAHTLSNLPRLDSAGRVQETASAAGSGPSSPVNERAPAGEDRSVDTSAAAARSTDSPPSTSPVTLNGSRPFGPRPPSASTASKPTPADEAPAPVAAVPQPEKEKASNSGSIGIARGLLGFGARRKSSMGPAPSTTQAATQAPLERTLTGASNHSLAGAVNNAWDAARSSATAGDESFASSHAQRDSSIADGTIIIDRGDPSSPGSRAPLPAPTPQSYLNAKADSPRDHSDSTNTPSASTGGRTVGGASEESSNGKAPHTPDELVAPRPLTAGRYDELHRKGTPPAAGVRPVGGEAFPSAGSPEPLARKQSLWERERERERHMEREAELARRLTEAEDRLRSRERDSTPRASAALASTPQSESLRDASSYSTSTSTPTRGDNRAGVGAYQGLGSMGSPPNVARAIQHVDEREQRERYAPAVGGSRLSGVSVNRTLSTESERSFVARMKARYQAEKEDHRDSPAAPSQANDGYRRVTSAAADMPRTTRRVSDIASSYSQRDGASAYERELREPDGMGGYVVARNSAVPAASTPQSRAGNSNYAYASAPEGASRSSYADERGYDEFGSQRDLSTRAALSNLARPVARMPQDAAYEEGEPAHSSICGCQKCSARNYGGAGSRGASSSTRPPQAYSSGSAHRYSQGSAPPPPPPRHPAAAAAERASAAQRGAAYDDGRSSVGRSDGVRRVSLPPNSSVPSREREYDTYDAPGSQHYEDAPRAAYPARRSYDEPERRVAFATAGPERR